MRGDKFAAKRSRAYRSERKAPAVDGGAVLQACVQQFVGIAHLDTEEQAVTLLVMAGLGVALGGPDRLEAAIEAFHASLESALT